ncbi:MAG: hypothetical protein HYW62_02335 [Candidatus Levybacteria bacterium]|nr:hypothetical protein [Candidatus Levybacteria bacterium]
MKRHNSMRGWFVYELFQRMKSNKKIYILTGDLGYKMLDDLRSSYPDRVLNVGAAEQAMVGIGVGLALQGKIPIIYSITTFLLYRPFETIRNYLDHESIPVKLIGGGRDKDYSDHGFCHWAEEDREVMKIFKNIDSRWPETLEEIPGLVNDMIKSDKPWYVNLRR